MSASSKKKLRNEQNAAKLTERQLAEQKEAKKLKVYTITFVAILALLLVVAIVFGAKSIIANSGIRERSTTAMTIDGKEVNNAEMNYYFIDAVNSFLSGENAYYVQLGFLDATKPLDEQNNPLNGQLWSDYLLEYATQNLKSNYALAAAAEAAGYTMPEDIAANADSVITNMEVYAAMYGYADTETYLKGMYGNGATMESYREYVETSLLAQAYYSQYSSELTYTDDDLRAAEAESGNKYASYTYNYYYLNTNKFLEGGTTDEEGNTTYTDEETAASVKAAEEAAKTLVGQDITSPEELDAAIAALSINTGSETPVSSTLYRDSLYSNVASEEVANWLSQAGRKSGDKAYLPNEVTSTDSETGETTTNINGYYIVYFQDSNDNAYALKNVRHILAAFEGGTYDSTTGATTYSDVEKDAAKAQAEALLEQWKSGEATEDSFAALANEQSDDGDGTTGGLYENVYPGQMVTAFNDWCFDESRKAGDTGIVETEYGYHVMYFSGDSETTYRDYMIENDLRSTDIGTWYSEMMDAMTIVEGNMSYVNTGLVLNAG